MSERVRLRARVAGIARRSAIVGSVAGMAMALAVPGALAAPSPDEVRQAVEALVAPPSSMSQRSLLAEDPEPAPAFEAPFDCQATVPGALACFELRTTSGSAQLGSFKTSLDDKPIVIRGGLDGTLSPIPMPAGDGGGDGGEGLPALSVPGGVTGIVPLQDLLDGLGLGGLTGASAAFALVGEPQFGLDLGSGSVTSNLPMYIDIKSLALGNTCTIGNRENPIQLAPAGGVQEIVADDASITLKLKLDDDTFAVPGAATCGPLGLGGLLSGVRLNVLDGIINQRLGLPAGSGGNHLNLLADLVIFP